MVEVIKICPNCDKGLNDGSHTKMDIIYCNAMYQLKSGCKTRLRKSS